MYRSLADNMQIRNFNLFLDSCPPSTDRQTAVHEKPICYCDRCSYMTFGNPLSLNTVYSRKPYGNVAQKSYLCLSSCQMDWKTVETFFVVRCPACNLLYDGMVVHLCLLYHWGYLCMMHQTTVEQLKSCIQQQWANTVFHLQNCNN